MHQVSINDTLSNQCHCSVHYVDGSCVSVASVLVMSCQLHQCQLCHVNYVNVSCVVSVKSVSVVSCQLRQCQLCCVC